MITKSYIIQWYEKFTNVDEVIPVSAKHGQGVEDVKQWILSKLPFGPAYYPKVVRISCFGSLLILHFYRLNSKCPFFMVASYLIWHEKKV